jgi:fructokinase
VARTIARLGEDSRFLGALSTDRFGSLIRRSLVADGVDVAWATISDRPTTLAAAEIDPSGAATYRFYLQGTSASSFSPEPHGGHVLSGVTALYVGTLGLVLEPMVTTVAALVADAPEELVVVVDPNCRTEAIDDRARYVNRLRDVVRQSDVVKVSVDDLAYLAPGLRPRDAARDLQRPAPDDAFLAAKRTYWESNGQITRTVKIP